jgi:hypothetical protein
MMSPERLRAFLHDVQRGYATRQGYVRVSVLWVHVPASKAQKADLEAALRLGLAHWPSLVPGTEAALTSAGVKLLESLK